MTARPLPPREDRVQPGPGEPVSVTLDGRRLTGIAGQSIAGVLLASGAMAWRTTAKGRRPRGLFCGIGVCFDCLATVNGLRDVRLCQRPARDGDVIASQDEELPRQGPGEVSR
jgi:D-hydroxyproline dehydrogenase subunit gamma